MLTKFDLFYLLLLFCINGGIVSGCIWPEVDALFILDSTPQVTSFQHRAEIDFLRQVMSTMKMSSSKVAMAQFTPWSSVEWSLANASYPESRVQEAPYCPCEQDNCPSTSINSLTRSTMNSANRKSVPDVILVISNSYQPLVEVLPNEPLISPTSPLHVFYIVIGSNMHVSRFEPSAHTVGIKVTDFEHLPHLVGPLCQSVNGYIKGTSTTRFGPLCWIIIGAILFFAIILVSLLAYAIYTYNEENRRLRHRIAESERLLRKQNEYFTSQLHTEMQKQIANGEKHAEEMKKQQDMMQNQFDRQLDMAYQQGSKIQILPPFLQPPHHHEHHSENTGKESNLKILNSMSSQFSGRGKNDRRDSGIASPRSPRDAGVQVTPIPTPIDDKKDGSEEDNESSGTSESVFGSSGSDVTDSTEEDLEELNRTTHLPRDHPARKLPPIDLMFLVDTSSSIGINNFDIQKNFICEILKDVDIAPGRSRISMVQYAQDPSVVFGFDQYYSYESVRRGVMRLSYTGGATMLSKALAFAGGIMYHEQNLKKTTKRHQFLPTPKHDRLQVLCLVSDGYSDDSADKESVNLHDRLHVKIFAVVTRSFNKDKLVPITRFDGSVFTVHQRESVAIWLWRQQRIWAEHYSAFIEKEKKRSARR
ncbi:hypothetical protein GCK72_017896 [Caenorhabditis remanei]|uniref:VWFA domain-containing protein n=1 Tax=Caenorhabditis remanei TaxID=31234 RepID=A0A6A5G9Z2_CAERE|nr:hypothetical protein GCK72_017896 [Caenorhabditis remanei]KAF1751342.1 hypothetical protein GCK72_017896 [Caenorhabditis remanei]